MKEGLKSSLLNKVKVTDKFWRGYQELVMDTVIPYQEKILNDEIPGVEKSHALANFRIAARSEERRVGKECLRLCRSRWSPYH